MTIINTEQGIKDFQFLARKHALSLEIKGLKKRGRSTYSICKEEYGLKGNRESVLKQMEQLWRETQEERYART